MLPMKKSFLILTALGAAATAHAQSSVTLSGTVDTTFQRGSGSIADRTQLGSGGNATSKLILRAIEDLGGGLAAFTHLEGGILADHGAGQPTTTNNNGTGAAGGGLTFNRRSIVGLRGSWGTFQAGRDWSPLYDAATTRFDPFGVSVGLAANYQRSVWSTSGLVRVSNALTYITPNLGGFFANLSHWRGEQPSNAGATEDDGTGSGVMLAYEKGPVKARAHWARMSLAAGDITARAIAMAYQFGPLSLRGVINRDKQGATDFKGGMLAAIYTLGASDIKASYSTIRSTAVGNPKVNKLALGYVYNLSKRTALYTTIAHVKNKGSSTYALNGATTAAGNGSSGFDIGLRHNF